MHLMCVCICKWESEGNKDDSKIMLSVCYIPASSSWFVEVVAGSASPIFPAVRLGCSCSISSTYLTLLISTCHTASIENNIEYNC